MSFRVHQQTVRTGTLNSLSVTATSPLNPRSNAASSPSPFGSVALRLRRGLQRVVVAVTRLEPVEILAALLRGAGALQPWGRK